MKEFMTQTIWHFKVIVKKGKRVETLQYWKTHQDFLPILLFYENDENFEIINYTAEIDNLPF